MPREDRNSGGPILLHERTVYDAAEIIDAGISVADKYYKEIKATEAQQMEDKTRDEYRNCIKHLYRFWMEKCPEYFEVGTRVLSDADKQDWVLRLELIRVA